MKFILGILIVFLIVAGGGAYLLTKDKNETDKTQNTTQTTDTTANQNTFSPASTKDLEFKATITNTKNGKTTTATLEHDSDDNLRYVAASGDQQVEIIYANDFYYTCTDENCVKFPASQKSNSGFNPEDYTYDSTEIANLKNNATYQGQKSCPAGTCDVWQSVNAGATSLIYIDKNTKRISQVETTTEGTTSKIVYQYTGVAIQIPANAQDFSTGH